ncbi:hypothetical protein [Micromonospora sp. WMMD1082]|uniref:hypothetical protein n=1 Tax=Micromonospora sp. WMMD1082 TaxID=3016104 RepID=UPI002417C4AC|nr:hypothetical protein [Micromonospora sp. WMMD1082]MDG4795104.1 hypothetical protein [Micromonospora sp. WMMD1082]
MEPGPLPRWEDETCAVCPAQALGPGRFDVVDRPGPQYAYRPAAGWRVGPDGRPVCVHPFRVGLPPGRYASAGERLPEVAGQRPAPSAAALELPAELDDLEGWLVATLRVAPEEGLFAAVARAERLAGERFAPGAVVAALRRVLSVELANR